MTDIKKYDKEIPLAVHVKEIRKNVLINREADFRDEVARTIIGSAKHGHSHTVFEKLPPASQIEQGFTNEVYNKVYKELESKGYKLDYSGQYLLVSWDE